jgi:murein DD-endopeptidase MepM/ murein hydrolase activator NlpD
MSTAPPPIPANLLFPMHQRPVESYHTRPRNFGGNRSGGRKHAGCDLYAPVGTAIRAMSQGTILRALYEFYGGTYALEVDHGTFVARYGEIQRTTASRFKVGDPVSPGAVIGHVGKLNNYNRSMLHLELYADTATGQLTVRNNPPFQRRRDLFDPTTWLDAARV